MGEVVRIAVHITLIHKCQDLDFYFLLLSYKLKPKNVVIFETNIYAESISTMQILKIYGVLKYIANISGLTAFARHSLGSCFFEGCDL